MRPYLAFKLAKGITGLQQFIAGNVVPVCHFVEEIVKAF